MVVGSQGRAHAGHVEEEVPLIPVHRLGRGDVSCGEVSERAVEQYQKVD